MNFKIQLTAIMLTLLITAQLLCQLSHGYTLKRIECTANPSICADKLCHFNFTQDEPKIYHLYMGCVLKETVTKLSVRIGTSYKSGKQYVAVRAVETLIDVCDIKQITSNTLLQTFAPEIVKELTRIFTGCPYKDELMINDLVLRGDAMPSLWGKKETKSELMFSKGKFLPMLTVVLYGTST